MKASDYIVEFLINKGIKDAFGYPGGMVTHLMNSFDKYKDSITAHLNYHEQASAMAACGWAEITGAPGVAYATSGPGATNLLTGIACAYFESLPCIFITGQVNTYEQKAALGVRQLGFQETDIVAMATPVTKYAVSVKSADDLPQILETAYQTAMSGRRGPVLIDIPMNVQRTEILAFCPSKCVQAPVQNTAASCAKEIFDALQRAKKPLLLLGHGIALSGQTQAIRTLVQRLGIPVVTSMIAVDSIPTCEILNLGFIGAYGMRCANFAVNHCDLLITLGSRLDCRQTGVNKEIFAPNATVMRVDIDSDEMQNRTSTHEIQICVPLQDLMPQLNALAENFDNKSWAQWVNVCQCIKEKLALTDAENVGNLAAKALGKALPDDICITTDVGQNQVWVAQSLPIKPHQRVLFSGGHGAMGYSLPAAIGAACATGNPVICCTGDGGLQMNLQEIQFIMRENLPVKIVLFNNHTLGMIHHFQEMYFNGNYVQTDASGGFSVPDFCRVAAGYGIRTLRCTAQTLQSNAALFADSLPLFLEISLPESTHVFPKLGMNKPIHEQEPPLPQALQQEIELLLNEVKA